MIPHKVQKIFDTITEPIKNQNILVEYSEPMLETTDPWDFVENIVANRYSQIIEILNNDGYGKGYDIYVVEFKENIDHYKEQSFGEGDGLIDSWYVYQVIEGSINELLKVFSLDEFNEFESWHGDCGVLYLVTGTKYGVFTHGT